MLERIRQVIQKFQLITTGQTLVVGVSGGADSLALLHLLHQLAPRLDVTLHAATLDHQLRGEESAEDARFVQQMCGEWGIAVTVGQTDVARLAREHQLGIEAAARVARYNFLVDVAHLTSAKTVAVAHHADDQAETVMLHLLRGTGIHGLAGMAPQAPMPGHTDLSLIRPLLSVTRAEIEAYCQQHNLIPRQDSTNADTTILRNAIRLEVLPYLQGYSPHVKSALGRLAEIAAVEDDFVLQQALAFTSSTAVKIAEGQIAIEREAVSKLHPALQRRTVLWSVAQLGQTENFGSEHIIEAIELALRGQQGAIALLGNGLQLRVEYAQLIIESNGEQILPNLPLLPMEFQQIVDIPSENQVGNWTLRIASNQPEANQPFAKLSLPDDAKVVLRTRGEGDLFAPLGMEGHSQKLSRWMVNRKIPRSLRDQIPLIVINGAIAALFVNGKWFVGEMFAVRNTTKRIIYFQFLENS